LSERSIKNKNHCKQLFLRQATAANIQTSYVLCLLVY